MVEIPLGYMLLVADSADELAEAVETRINRGWAPQGGVAFTWQWDAEGIRAETWAQALVRYSTFTEGPIHE